MVAQAKVTPAPGPLNGHVQDQIGCELRLRYGALLREPVPDHLRSDHPVGAHRTEDNPVTASPEIREAMLAAISSLRAFAISLARNLDYADDLV